MDLKQELINRLGVPENWDKYDYQTQRYSFDDMQEVLEDIVKKLTIPVVSQQRELLFAFLEWLDYGLKEDKEYWVNTFLNEVYSK